MLIIRVLTYFLKCIVLLNLNFFYEKGLKKQAISLKIIQITKLMSKSLFDSIRLIM